MVAKNWSVQLILGSVILVFVRAQNSVVEEEELELTEFTTCEVCKCGFGPNSQPKELVTCADLEQPLKVSSLPAFVSGIHVKGAKNGVTFNRGAIRVKTEKFVFRVTVEDANQVDFQEKCTTILAKNGSARFDLTGIGLVKFGSRTVSTVSGNFELRVNKTIAISVVGHAFDVITKIDLDGIGKLDLAPAALKPNVPLARSQPVTKIDLKNINSIPSLPMEAFGSSARISFYQCNVGDIEASAFSGTMILNVNFVQTSIDRIHSRALHDRAWIQTLSFVNCSLASISEKAVISGISKLIIDGCNVSSISTEAFKVQVANVEIVNSVYKTLVKKSLTFQSWNNVVIKDNVFSYLEEESFNGIREPNSNDALNFTFVGNAISVFNRNALKIESLAEDAPGVGMGAAATGIEVGGNLFDKKECTCDFDRVLMMLTGEADPVNPNRWTQSLMNSSLCLIPSFSMGCFSGKTRVLLPAYVSKMCSAFQEDCSYVSPWEVIYEHIEVNTDKGILLIVLVFVLASTLVVGIITLLRWIVYTVQMRKYRRTDEWSFTKVEEQKKIIQEEEVIELEESPSPTQHYESLPLTTTEVIEDNDDTNVKEVEADKKPEAEPLLKADLPEVATVAAPPTGKTFYDEMICLLQEKLEDPENYATVVDDNTNPDSNATQQQQQMLYMDPMNVQKQ